MIADLPAILDELLSNGRFWSTEGATAIAGEKNVCHKNALNYYSDHAETHYLVTGFALGRSLWVWHSWVVVKATGEVLEVTTPRPFEAYYGFEVSGDKEIKFFARHIYVADDL